MRTMKRMHSFALVILTLLIMLQFGQSIEYSVAVPSGAPVPVAPENPESSGISMPSEQTLSSQEPPSSEKNQALIPTDESSVKSAQGITAGSQTVEGATYASQAIMMVPRGVQVSNGLYASYVPQTVAGCALNGWQPIWLHSYSSGPLWFYEWYPNGQLDAKYLGYSYPGWNKRWFNGDTPGWHILQYYSGGWSNYIYIYVFGWESNPWIEPRNYLNYYYPWIHYSLCSYGQQQCHGRCCPEGQPCVNGQCKPPEPPSMPGQPCVNGLCKPPISMPLPPEGQPCVNGLCEPISIDYNPQISEKKDL